MAALLHSVGGVCLWLLSDAEYIRVGTGPRYIIDLPTNI